MYPCFDKKVSQHLKISKNKHAIVELRMPPPPNSATDFIILAMNESKATLENTHLYHRAIIQGESTRFQRGSEREVVSGMAGGAQHHNFVSLSGSKMSLQKAASTSTTFLHVGNGNDTSVQLKILLTLRDASGRVKVKTLPGVYSLDADTGLVEDISGFIPEGVRSAQAVVVYNPYQHLVYDNGSPVEGYFRVASTRQHSLVR